MIENSFGHEFGGRVLMFESDDPVTVTLLEVRIGRIIRVHAESVIESIKPLTQCRLDDFEIADHLIVIEFRRFQNKLHLTRVPVRELALVGVLGEHVAIFDLDGFANSVGHKKNDFGEVQVPRVFPKRAMWSRGQNR